MILKYLRKIFKDRNGLNIFQVIKKKHQIEIYDFNSNSSIWAWENFVDLTIPEELDAAGVFADGFPAEATTPTMEMETTSEAPIEVDPPVRKRRSVGRNF